MSPIYSKYSKITARLSYANACHQFAAEIMILMLWVSPRKRSKATHLGVVKLFFVCTEEVTGGGDRLSPQDRRYMKICYVGRGCLSRGFPPMSQRFD